jgi:tetratricopeptide (TPR) repeat protein
MTRFSKSLACGALCAFLGVAQGSSGQAVSVSQKRVREPQDPPVAVLNNLLTTAQAAMDRKEYGAAAQSYQEYLTHKPDDATAHFQLGYAYTALEQPAKAKPEYEKAISLDPKMSAAYLNLGLTLLDTDPGAAIEPLQKAVELLPDQARPKFLLGWALERSGKLAAAIEKYRVAEALEGKNFNIRFALARTLLSSNRAADAEAEFQTALALRPDSAPAHLGMAQSLFAEMKWKAAAGEYRTYLEAQPNDAAARIERASALMNLGNEDDALAELDRAAGTSPEEVHALKLRSQIYFAKGRYDEAASALQKAAALAPQDPDIPARLGHLHLQKKDYPQAVRELTAAFQMDPSANDVLGDLVAAQYLNKNYPAALEGLDLLSRREELPAGSWFIRATCYDKLGQAAEALASYQKFLALNKDEDNDMYFEATARARYLSRVLKEKKR